MIEDLHGVLDEELGLLPGPAIRELQSAILQQDSSIDWERPVSAVPDAPTPAATEPDPAPAPPAADTVPGYSRGPPPAGRTRLAELSAAWQRSVSGSTEFVVISGEAGIGKTRLVAETVATAARDGPRRLGPLLRDDGAPPL